MNNKKPIQQIDRRTILHGLVAAGGSLLIPSGVFGASSRNRPVSPNEKVNLACVGIGNRGLDVVKALNDTGLVNIVALCDTQMGARHTLDAISLAPGARRFLDFRDMFDKMGKQFDAVSIAIPDHSHFPVAMLAMNQGKHIYVEKPMAHSFRQVELMMAAEKKYKVACQMGNQGHSEANYFQFKAWVEAGIIKNVTKITAFMNAQRRWHGMTVDGFKEAQGLPDVMDWDAWIATAKDIPFNRAYLNGEWRSWYEFGNGALGDWGAHIFDTAHQFLELGMPNEVDLTHVEGHSQWLFPQASTIAFRFPKRGNKPACEMTWYDGQKNLPPLPADFGGVTVDPNIPPPTAGTLNTKVNPPGKVIYGEGLTFKGGSHASTLEILSKEAAASLTLPDVQKTPSNHFLNFVRGCKGEEVCRSNFSIAGPLSQVMALGVIAQRVNGKLKFDAKRKRITNHKVANELLKGVPPRKDWEQFYKM